MLNVNTTTAITDPIQLLRDEMICIIPDPEIAVHIETIKCRCFNCNDKAWGANLHKGWAFRNDLRCNTCNQIDIPKYR